MKVLCDYPRLVSHNQILYIVLTHWLAVQNDWKIGFIGTVFILTLFHWTFQLFDDYHTIKIVKKSGKTLLSSEIDRILRSDPKVRLLIKEFSTQQGLWNRVNFKFENSWGWKLELFRT